MQCGYCPRTVSTALSRTPETSDGTTSSSSCLCRSAALLSTTSSSLSAPATSLWGRWVLWCCWSLKSECCLSQCLSVCMSNFIILSTPATFLHGLILWIWLSKRKSFEKRFEMCILLITEFDHPEVTLRQHGWQDVKIQLLTNSLSIFYVLLLFLFSTLLFCVTGLTLCFWKPLPTFPLSSGWRAASKGDSLCQYVSLTLYAGVIPVKIITPVPSDSHLGWIGWEALARIGPDDSFTLACFQTGSFWPNADTVSQN